MEFPKDSREFLANERTFLAWIRTSIAIIALGFVVVKFGLFLKQISSFATHNNPVSARAIFHYPSGYSQYISLFILLVGVIIIPLSYWRSVEVNKQISRASILKSIFFRFY